MAAKKDKADEVQLEDGYVIVVAPTGAETIVPETILGDLLASGYTKK